MHFLDRWRIRGEPATLLERIRFQLRARAIAIAARLRLQTQLELLMGARQVSRSHSQGGLGRLVMVNPTIFESINQWLIRIMSGEPSQVPGLGGKTMKLIIVGLTVLSAFTAIFFVSHPLNKFTIFNANSNLEASGFPNLRLDQEFDSASIEMQSLGFEESRYWDSHKTSCLGESNPNADQTHLFTDSSWRKGSVCLFVSDGRVVGASWYFNPLAP